MNSEIKEQEISYRKSNFAEERNSSKIYNIKESLLSGSAAFVLFFSLIIITKIIAVSSKSTNIFELTVNDFIIAFWGFIIFSATVFLSKNR